MRHIISVLFILSTLSFVQLVGQTNGVTFFGHLDQPHGSSGQGTQYSACWGWTSPDGREYALLGTFTGTSIIDINSDTLREVQFIPGPPATYAYREIKTHKQYAYIVSEGGSGVQIVDLSGLPDTAILIKNFIYTANTPPDSGKNNARSHTIAYADGYLYLNGSANWSPGGVLMFSLLNDPLNPQYAGKYEPKYVHDSYIRNDTLYAASINTGGGLYVVDVKDKAHPSELVYISYTGSGTHHAWASIDGRYAFTTDEIGTTQSNLKIWDLQNLGPGPPYNPAATYSASPITKIHNVHGRGHYAYISHYAQGMHVVDVHNPAAPLEAGWYHTYGDTTYGSYAGCWGVYPYFPSGKWIGSDMQTGLYVCRFNGLKPRIRPHLLEPPDDLTFMTNKISFTWNSAADQSEDPHYYEVHIHRQHFEQSFDTIVTTRDTSYSIADMNFIVDGGEYTWYVNVRDEFTTVVSVDTFHFHTIIEFAEDPPGLPLSPKLAQNYPNPFNPLTKIEFELNTSSEVSLQIYDVTGRKVKSLLANRLLPSGKQEVVFDATDLPSGIYFYRLITPKYSETKKMILTK